MIAKCHQWLRSHDMTLWSISDATFWPDAIFLFLVVIIVVDNTVVDVHRLRRLE